MNKREEYINKVKTGIELRKVMESLEDGQNLHMMYNGTKYEIHCSVYKDEERLYSIGDTALFGRRMNIDLEKSGKSFLLCYTYDLFSNRTTHRVDFGKVKDIVVIDIPKEEEKK